jgi:hypothetical protein
MRGSFFRQSEYMTEKEAVQKGHRPANGTGARISNSANRSIAASDKFVQKGSAKCNNENSGKVRQKPTKSGQVFSCTAGEVFDDLNGQSPYVAPIC